MVSLFLPLSLILELLKFLHTSNFSLYGVFVSYIDFICWDSFIIIYKIYENKRWLFIYLIQASTKLFDWLVNEVVSPDIICYTYNLKVKNTII